MGRPINDLQKVKVQTLFHKSASEFFAKVGSWLLYISEKLVNKVTKKFNFFT